VAAQFNGAIAREIFNWLNRFRNISGLDDADNIDSTAGWLNRVDYSAQIKELTRQADTGIEDIRAIERPFGLGDAWAKQLGISAMASYAEPGISIKTYHQKFNAEQKPVGRVEFDFGTDESAGTQKFVSLAGPFLEALMTGSILFVDELEARLHPLLTRALVSRFNSSTNRRDGQLVFASHDVGLLDPKRIRRDQVWFVEKDDLGASRLYSLAEFKVRKDAKFDREYLLGLFGSVPRITNTQDLLANAAD
jgi:hypothetical protein